MILQTHTQFHKCTYYKIFAVSEYCEQHTGQSQYCEQHTRQSQYCEQHTRQSQYCEQHTGQSQYCEQHTRQSQYCQQHTGQSQYCEQHTGQSQYCEQHTGQSQYWEQHTCQSQYCEQHTCQSQYINQQRLSQCLNYLNKRDTKGTYNVSTLAFNMIITRQLSPATSCRFLHHIDMAHLATTHTHGKVPTGSNEHLSDKIGTL